MFDGKNTDEIKAVSYSGEVPNTDLEPTPHLAVCLCKVKGGINLSIYEVSSYLQQV
jgi:hypothetical protein